MLLAKLNEHCIIHTDKHIEKYEDPGTGPVTMYFRDGTTAQADVLVGADGVHSAVRSTFFGNLAAMNPSQEEKYTRCMEAKFSGTYAYRHPLSTAKIREINPDHPALKAMSTIVRAMNQYSLITLFLIRYFSKWCGKDKVDSQYFESY